MRAAIHDPRRTIPLVEKIVHAEARLALEARAAPDLGPARGVTRDLAETMSAGSSHGTQLHPIRCGSNFYRRRYPLLVQAKKISISVGKRQLALARQIAKREGLSLSAIFIRGLDRELEAEERRAALEELVRDLPPVPREPQRQVRAAWERKTTAP